MVKAEKVTLDNLSGPNECEFANSGVIVGEMAGSITLTDSELSGNDCAYIYADRTPVTILRSNFTEGLKSSYVTVLGSTLYVSKSVF